jgi:predicted MPP superfamily phosphohydrolase
MNRLSFVISVVMAMTAYVFLHVLAYTRVAHGLGLPVPKRLHLKIGMALAALPFILAEAFSSASWVSPLVYVGSAWLGILAMALALFPVEWLLSQVFPEQRRTITLFALLVLLGLAACTLVNGSRPPVVRHITISLEKMPAGSSGFTLVQLSDLHLGHLTSLDRLRWIVDQINGMSADLVAITGDLADPDIGQDSEFCQCLKEIRARHGVVAVPGNHDYLAGIDRFLQLAGRSNITVLRNERLLLAGAIQVAGLDEAAGRSSTEGGPDMEKALAGYDSNRPIIVLSHWPYGFDRAVRKNIDLQLSGHTHAGQIPPIDLLVWLTSPYSVGYYENGRSRLYTSCGTGTWGPPMRFLSRNEIVKFTLVPDNRMPLSREHPLSHRIRPGGRRRSSAPAACYAAVSMGVMIPLQHLTACPTQR